jgi:aldose 1-epimerase
LLLGNAVALTLLAACGAHCQAAAPHFETSKESTVLASGAAQQQIVTARDFGKTADGTPTTLFTASNRSGMTIQVTDYGARLVSLMVADRQGRFANVTLGFDSAEKYNEHTAYMGCTTGRYANRIAKGRFTLEGREYRLAINNGDNHLHGGRKGFDRHVWKGEALRGNAGPAVRFTLRSPDGDEGYPGNLDVTVTYTLTEENELRIDYRATTDKPTVLNLTNHAYWNLAGRGDILGHRLTIAADHFLPVDDGLIPTGKLAPVAGTPMDFTEPFEIGARIAETKKGVPPPGGYDHCYVLREKSGKLAFCARVDEPASGRRMDVWTTEPAVQLYTGNFLDGSQTNGGFAQHAAFCLETQHYPDSPNQPGFPLTVLKPGQTNTQTTTYKFLTQ